MWRLFLQLIAKKLWFLFQTICFNTLISEVRLSEAEIFFRFSS